MKLGSSTRVTGRGWVSNPITSARDVLLFGSVGGRSRDDGREPVRVGDVQQPGRLGSHVLVLALRLDADDLPGRRDFDAVLSSTQGRLEFGRLNRGGEGVVVEADLSAQPI